MTPKEPKLNEKFIMNIKGKEFVLYSGLLDLAHQKGIRSIHVEPVQYPVKDNGMEAICKAVVISSDGQEFTEIGDANPRNVNSMIREHILRMAATRCKARALRDFTNIGMTCLEELGDLDQVIGGNAKPVKPQAKNSEAKTEPQETDNESGKPAHSGKQAVSDAGKETKKDENIQKTTEAQTGKAADSKAKKEETRPQQSKSRGNAAPANNDAKISIAQKNAIMSLAKRRSIDTEEISNMLEQVFNRSSLDYLSASEASAFIRQLQQAA